MFKPSEITNSLMKAAHLVLIAITVVAQLAPFLPGDGYYFLSFFSLAMPFLWLGHTLFLLYWIFRWKSMAWWSVIVLLLTHWQFGPVYRWNNSQADSDESALTVMSYNVKLLNKYRWTQEEYLADSIVAFAQNSQADVLAFQEFDTEFLAAFKQYPYQTYSSRDNKERSVVAILSKYPIVSKGRIDFPSSSNTAIYADIELKDRVVRVYNTHFQSLKLMNRANQEVLRDTTKSKWAQRLAVLYDRIGRSFDKQESQSVLLSAHKERSPYPNIVLGDFNNNQFSSVYHTIRTDMKDTFFEKGVGFGSTFRFVFLPLRIDYVLVDQAFEVSGHQVTELPYSDHFPVLVRLNFTSPN